MFCRNSWPPKWLKTKCNQRKPQRLWSPPSRYGDISISWMFTLCEALNTLFADNERSDVLHEARVRVYWTTA